MTADAILSLLESTATIARDDVVQWMTSSDLRTMAATYRVLRDAAARIDPPLTSDDPADFIRRYLVRCLEEDHRGNDLVLGGYSASWELAAWLKRWQREPKPNAVLRGVAKDLERAFRRGDNPAKNRIICGVLEHAFELPAVRPLFESWKRDPELSEAYQLANEWGRSHEE